MRENKLLITTLGIIVSIIIIFISASLIIGNEYYEAAKANYYEKNLKKMSSLEQFTTLLSLIVYGAKGTLVIILFISIIQYLIAVPLGIYATNKNGIFKLLINMLNGFFSRIPPIISAIIFINLPFLIFSNGRYLWAILILAFIGVGRVSKRIYNESMEASSSERVIIGKRSGYRGFYLLLYFVFPMILPSILYNFFKDLGKTTALLAQLGIFNILVSKTIIDNEGQGFGQLMNTEYNWTTILGNTTRVVVHAPLAPLMPILAFVITITIFNMLGDGVRSYYKNKVNTPTTTSHSMAEPI